MKKLQAASTPVLKKNGEHANGTAWKPFVFRFFLLGRGERLLRLLEHTGK